MAIIPSYSAEVHSATLSALPLICSQHMLLNLGIPTSRMSSQFGHPAARKSFALCRMEQMRHARRSDLRGPPAPSGRCLLGGIFSVRHQDVCTSGN